MFNTFLNYIKNLIENECNGDIMYFFKVIWSFSTFFLILYLSLGLFVDFVPIKKIRWKKWFVISVEASVFVTFWLLWLDCFGISIKGTIPVIPLFIMFLFKIYKIRHKIIKAIKEIKVVIQSVGSAVEKKWNEEGIKEDDSI